MNKITGIIVLFSICAYVAAYSDVDDTLNIEAMVKDKALFQSYIDCFLDRKPCTPQMQAYKSHLLEAMSDGCKECNKIEKHMMRIFIPALKTTASKDDFQAFSKKFDPNGHIDTSFADVARF